MSNRSVINQISQKSKAQLTHSDPLDVIARLAKLFALPCSGFTYKSHDYMRGIKLCYLMKDSACWASKLLVLVMSDYLFFFSLLLGNYYSGMKPSHMCNAFRWNVSSPAHCRIVAISFSTSSRALSRSLAMSKAVKQLQSAATLPQNKFHCAVTLTHCVVRE